MAGVPPGVELCYAARLGDLKRLRKQLDAGVDPNARNRQGSTALHDAAWNGHVVCLYALLAAGAQLHCVESYSDTSFDTALNYAVCAGQAGCVRALLAAGFDVSRTRGGYRELFRQAFSRGCCRVLKIVLRAGAEVDTQGTRRQANDAWALIDAIREDGGWLNYAARRPPTIYAGVVFKATHGELPAPLPLEIAAFLVPPGGFSSA